jgi:lipopolysaccharide assembly protein A
MRHERTREEAAMRWVYLAVIVLFAAATIIFAAQNFQIVTIAFLGASARTPLALLVAVIYLLGAVTGGSLLALLRRSVEGARRYTAGAS